MPSDWGGNLYADPVALEAVDEQNQPVKNVAEAVNNPAEKPAEIPKDASTDFLAAAETDSPLSSASGGTASSNDSDGYRQDVGDLLDLIPPPPQYIEIIDPETGAVIALLNRLDRD